MKIGITGATGFIGSNLLDKLSKSKRDKITILTQKEPNRAIQKLKKTMSNSKAKISIKKVKLSNKENIEKEFRESGFDLIYHVAGLRGISVKKLTEYIEANTSPTKILSELCLKYNVNLVYISSVGVHGTIPHKLPCTEDSPFVPDCNYHYSKILAEKQIFAKLNDGLNAIILRPTITYGSFDYGFLYKIIKLVDLHLRLFSQN